MAGAPSTAGAAIATVRRAEASMSSDEVPIELEIPKLKVTKESKRGKQRKERSIAPQPSSAEFHPAANPDPIDGRVHPLERALETCAAGACRPLHHTREPKIWPRSTLLLPRQGRLEYRLCSQTCRAHRRRVRLRIDHLGIGKRPSDRAQSGAGHRRRMISPKPAPSDSTLALSRRRTQVIQRKKHAFHAMTAIGPLTPTLGPTRPSG